MIRIDLLGSDNFDSKDYSMTVIQKKLNGDSDFFTINDTKRRERIVNKKCVIQVVKMSEESEKARRIPIKPDLDLISPRGGREY